MKSTITTEPYTDGDGFPGTLLTIQVDGETAITIRLGNTESMTLGLAIQNHKTYSLGEGVVVE